MTKMNLETRKIDAIQPYEKNPRINEHAVAAVADSISAFGFRQPIVVDADGVIIVGHTRWKAAQLLGLDTVPVIVAADLTPEQAKAYRLADNKTGELAEWDMEILPVELSDLQQSGEIDLSALGFNLDELDKLLTGELDEEDSQSVTNPDHDGSGSGAKFMRLDEYTIPLTDEEVELLKARLADYLNANGTLYGFIAEAFHVE
jgi:hypothetical protein